VSVRPGIKEGILDLDAPSDGLGAKKFRSSSPPLVGDDGGDLGRSLVRGMAMKGEERLEACCSKEVGGGETICLATSALKEDRSRTILEV
jgi:hypothetical protein